MQIKERGDKLTYLSRTEILKSQLRENNSFINIYYLGLLDQNIKESDLKGSSPIKYVCNFLKLTGEEKKKAEERWGRSIYTGVKSLDINVLIADRIIEDTIYNRFFGNSNLSNNLPDFDKSFPMQDDDLFTKHFEAGKVLNLSDKQAKLFASIAMDYDSQKTMEVTGIHTNSSGSFRRELARKLGLKKFDIETIKELANTLLNPYALESARKVYKGSIRDKIDVAKEHIENKKLADMVRANPELLQALQQINQSQHD